MEPGRYTVQWDGTNDHGAPVSSGIYLYRLKQGAKVDSKKAILLR
jgi:flagellar hook assembly protein FlgD